MLNHLAVLALLAVAAVSHHGNQDDLHVQTDLFSVRGTTEVDMPSVRVFRGVPFAEPPTGNNRFLPPVTKLAESKVLDATKFGPSCIQLNTGVPTAYTEYLSGFLLTPGQVQDEDCLTLNIWAPRASANQSLPVMIYIPGGGFTSGGSASPYKYGGPIVRNNQDVIVVTLNYRVNVFGFPSAAALDGHNLNPGLLDQRKAIEWCHAHISAFGGDPDRMILWGQSAGAASTDKYAYAYPNDPIVTGFALDSATADAIPGPAVQTTNFTYVARQVNCTQTDKDAEFACMQRVSASAIINVLNTYNATRNSGTVLTFGPVADNETSFSNYTDRRIRGQFAQLPTLVGINNNEGATLVPYIESGPNQTVIEAFTQNVFNCPAAKAAQGRAIHDIPVWRYRYFGTFPNVNPLPWLGAYHSSELPIVFDTADYLGPNTALENATIEHMQGAWVAFAKDPANGLNDYGWPEYNATQRTLVELGYRGNAEAVFALGNAFDGSCRGTI